MTEKESLPEADKCIFCQIIDAEIEANIVHSDDDIIVIPDINPKAPVHLLIIPRKHVESIAEMEKEDTYLLGHMAWTAKMMGDEHYLSANGYKIIINTGRDGGQTVPHVHMHLLGGQALDGFAV